VGSNPISSTKSQRLTSFLTTGCFSFCQLSSALEIQSACSEAQFAQLSSKCLRTSRVAGNRQGQRGLDFCVAVFRGQLECRVCVLPCSAKLYEGRLLRFLILTG